MQIGREILIAARNELFMNMPYLDLAFSALGIESGEDKTETDIEKEGVALRVRQLPLLVNIG